MSRTGLRYLGEARYAYKRALGHNSFIPLSDLFAIYQKASGFSQPSRAFIQWMFDSGNIPGRDFEFEVDPLEFDSAGNFLGPVSSEKSVPNRRMTEERPPKSSQIVKREQTTEPEAIFEDFEDSEEPQELMEAADIQDHHEEEIPAPPAPVLDSSGTVKVESGEVHVSDSVEKAQQDLIEQSKSLRHENADHIQRRNTTANIIENKQQKPASIEQSSVVAGGTNKRNKSNRTRSVVLANNQSPEEGQSVNPNVRPPMEESRSFVYEPAPSQLDVNANPVVNYGGKNIKPREEKTKIDAAPEVVAGSNTMNQPAMANPSDIRGPITIDAIVRNSSDSAALEAINTCKNSKILKLAGKQLRNMGNKPRLEQAIARRISTLPPGSVG